MENKKDCYKQDIENTMIRTIVKKIMIKKYKLKNKHIFLVCGQNKFKPPTHAYTIDFGITRSPLQSQHNMQ